MRGAPIDVLVRPSVCSHSLPSSRRSTRRGHTYQVIPVPASTADLRLTLFDERELEVDAGVSGPWSDLDWTSLPLPSANHCVGGVNLDGVEKLLFGNYLSVSRLD